MLSSRGKQGIESSKRERAQDADTAHILTAFRNLPVTTVTCHKNVLKSHLSLAIAENAIALVVQQPYTG